jgi:drug/metabolite transporter (DMT)-like permease
VSIGQLAAGAVIIAPFALAQLPDGAPSAGAIAAVVALGALGSGIAYLLYFAIIARAGASRAILVTYLVPAFALVYGAVFLDEKVTVSALAGLALILCGTALATGAARTRGSDD